MEQTNRIETLFKFTTEGYKEANEELTSLLEKSRKEKAELKKISEAADKQERALKSLMEVWKGLDSSMNETTPKSVREEFERLKNKILELEESLKKLKKQGGGVGEQHNNTAAKLKKAAKETESYRKAMDSLAVGIKNTNTQISDLTTAQNVLKRAMSAMDINSAAYKNLSKDLAQVENALKQVRAEQAKAAKEMGVNENSVEALRLRVSALNAEWLKMDRNSPDFVKTKEELAELRAELTKAETEVGIFSRNVGNYKSGFDGLGGSITQITREAPAFANSLTTGFMAISNNLPMLFDEINKLRKANAALNAEGIKTPAIWKTVLKSALSWNTALSVGVTLLTVYGADLVKWIGSLFKGKDALDSMREAQKKYNEELNNSYSSEAEQIVLIQKLSKEWVALGGDVKKQKQYLVDNKKVLDDTGIAINTVADAENIFVENTDAYIAALGKRTEAEVKQRIAMQYLEETLKKEQEAEQRKVTWWDYTRAFLGGSIKNIKQNAERLAEISAEEKLVEANQAREISNKFLEESIEDLKQYNETVKSIGLTTSDEAKKQQEEWEKMLKEQQKINEAYKKTFSERLQAQQDYARALEEGSEEEIERYKKNLDNKNKAFADAASKRITLSQAELDELELQEYLSQKEIEKIQKEGQDRRNENYIKAGDAVIDTQEKILDAQKRGDAEGVRLYTQLLALRTEDFKKAGEKQLDLSEEQQAEEKLKWEKFKQDQLEEYVSQMDALYELEQQYQQATSAAEQQAVREKIANQEKAINAYRDLLESFGIETAGVWTQTQTGIASTEQSLQAALQQSLGTIKQFAGKSKNLFLKLSTSLSGLIFSAFDFKKQTDGMDKTADAYKEKYKEFLGEISSMGAAAGVTILNEVTANIFEGLKQELEATEEYYDKRKEMSKESYDSDMKLLDKKLKQGKISEAKYALEKLKLEDEQAAKENEIEKQKANKQYEIELKLFRVQQAQDAASAAIATALAIMQTLAAGAGFFSSPLIPVVTALGAAQIAAIYAQKPPERPEFRKGGVIDFMNINGPSHEEGGVPVTIGNEKIAEVEGGEGALIISRKAMKYKGMKYLLQAVEAMNEAISGGQLEPDKFAEGGYLGMTEDDKNDYLSYDRIHDEIKNSLDIEGPHWWSKRKIKINGKKINLKDYGNSVDMAIDAYVEPLAKEEFNRRRNSAVTELENIQKTEESKVNANIQNNSYLASQGIGNIDEYNAKVSDIEEDVDIINDKIDAYEELKDAATEALKAEMRYDERMEEFDKQREDAEQELADATLAINERVLKELYESGELEKDEYLSMLDQVRNGYGATTDDIIALKKQQVGKVKKLIEEERQAEIDAANETADYQKQALEQIRTDWEEEYNAVTEKIVENVLEAGDAVNSLTGSDLERYNQLLAIEQEIERMNERYKENETLLSDGVIQSREEQARLVAEQQRIQEELEIKEQEAEEAKAAFEEERNKNMEAALKAFETTNFDSLLEQIKTLGASLQEEGSKWSLDKQITAELEANLKNINSVYDEQIAAQDAIVNGLQAEIDKLELLYDKKVAYIDKEEAAFQESYDKRQAYIDEQYEKATANLMQEAQSLNSLLAMLKTAGVEAGIVEYQKIGEWLADEISSMPSARYATGGAIDLGNGIFEALGNSHSNGGIPVFVGNKQIAEIEGHEKLLVLNKDAAQDPQMVEALNRISSINEQYTGVPILPPQTINNMNIDYDLLAMKIGEQINMRPVHTYFNRKDVGTAEGINKLYRRSVSMK